MKAPDDTTSVASGRAVLQSHGFQMMKLLDENFAGLEQDLAELCVGGR
jgi:hypothetical protein